MKISGKAVTATALAVLLGGCASSKSVDEKIAEAQAQQAKKLESVEGQIEELQSKQKATDQRVDQTNARVEQLSREAQDALKRATDAGVLAKGKVAFQQTFNEDRVRFSTGKYDLDSKAKEALDDFAGKVKALNEAYFVEIQGHTDNVGGKRYNEELGERRAEAVRRYLSRQHGIALNRMSTISYGDTLPAGSNKTKKGRAENRRVVIVVLE
jgi:outer membrane protein OmpA-like peptidoglycan-associated protein